MGTFLRGRFKWFEPIPTLLIRKLSIAFSATIVMTSATGALSSHAQNADSILDRAAKVQSFLQYLENEDPFIRRAAIEEGLKSKDTLVQDASIEAGFKSDDAAVRKQTLIGVLNKTPTHIIEIPDGPAGESEAGRFWAGKYFAIDGSVPINPDAFQIRVSPLNEGFSCGVRGDEVLCRSYNSNFIELKVNAAGDLRGTAGKVGNNPMSVPIRVRVL